jgi:hypothetical protein
VAFLPQILFLQRNVGFEDVSFAYEHILISVENPDDYNVLNHKPESNDWNLQMNARNHSYMTISNGVEKSASASGNFY